MFLIKTDATCRAHKAWNIVPGPFVTFDTSVSLPELNLQAPRTKVA